MSVWFVKLANRCTCKDLGPAVRGREGLIVCGMYECGMYVVCMNACSMYII